MIPSYFQTDSWGKFKAQFGWRVERFGNLIALERKLIFNQKILYFPEIPFNEESLSAVRRIISERSHKKYLLIRFEFLEPWSADGARSLSDLGLVKSFEEVQPEYRQWIPLDKDEDEILAQMKPKGRYNIAVAKKHSLRLETGLSNKLIEDFFSLYQETAQRTKFSGRGKKYFQQLCQTIGSDNSGEIIAVYKDKTPLAAGIFLYYKSMASYLYGASGGDRSFMAPYLMHYNAIERSKQRGCKTYDLLAISPTDGNKSNHPYDGITKFKQRFGGSSLKLLGSWDLVGSVFWYNLYKLVEKIRRKSTR